MDRIKVGTIVRYAGSMPERFHGLYTVASGPWWSACEDERGYVLAAAERTTEDACRGRRLHHVSRASITPEREVTR